MSLVAYAGSDESDEEEKEAMPSTSSKSEPIMSGHISDEEDHYAGVSSSTGGTLFSTFLTTVEPDTGESNQSERINSTSVASLEDLPAPRKKQTLDDKMPQESELETEVLPKAAELAAAPKPPKKQRQPAQISIPSLINEEDDEEEEENSKKKPKPSGKPSGLFSLLPAPIHSSKKEINRPLIPHTLTRKPVTSVKKDTQVKEVSSSQGSSAVPKTTRDSHPSAKGPESSIKSMTTFNALTGYDSDSDDDTQEVQGSSLNFFSLGENSKGSSKDNSKAPIEQTASIDSTVDSSDKVKSISNKKDGEVPPHKAEEEVKVELGAINDAPLDFGSTSRLNSLTSASYSNLLPVGPSGPVMYRAAPAVFGGSDATTDNIQSSSSYAEAYDVDESDDIYSNIVPSEDLKQFMNDKEFHRFQGKRKRGLEDEINFVDARVDDYVDPSEVSKHMTEETEYVSAKKDKDNMPTSQQKRKKQITYLAYQAKEKEFELKNAWAQSKMTKKQTQSKYGF